MIDHRSYTNNLSRCGRNERKKKSGLKGIRTHELCDTSALPSASN